MTYSTASPITATFVDPAHPSSPAVTNFVSVAMDLQANGVLSPTLTALDLNGNVLTSFSTLDSAGGLLTVSAPGIHSVVFSGSADFGGIALDNFSFNPVTPVPEPASLALLACGSGLLLKRHRRGRWGIW